MTKRHYTQREVNKLVYKQFTRQRRNVACSYTYSNIPPESFFFLLLLFFFFFFVIHTHKYTRWKRKTLARKACHGTKAS